MCVCMLCVACPLYVHDQLALGLNILMKDGSKSKEHEITYLVGQRRTHTWQAMAARHREEKQREREVGYYQHTTHVRFECVRQTQYS